MIGVVESGDAETKGGLLLRATSKQTKKALRG